MQSLKIGCSPRHLGRLDSLAPTGTAGEELCRNRYDAVIQPRLDEDSLRRGPGVGLEVELFDGFGLFTSDQKDSASEVDELSPAAVEGPVLEPGPPVGVDVVESHGPVAVHETGAGDQDEVVGEDDATCARGFKVSLLSFRVSFCLPKRDQFSLQSLDLFVRSCFVGHIVSVSNAK